MQRRTRLIIGGGAVVAALAIVGTIRSAESSKQPEDVGPLSPMDGPIVDNPAPDPERPAFVLSREPVLTVGKLREDIDNELWQVRDAVLTPDGGMAVINPSYEVRLFDSTGRSVRLIAGKGEGPGEVQSANGLARLRGDSLAVWDVRLRRLTTFDAAGRVARTTRVPPGRVICCLADGAMLATEFHSVFPPPPVRQRLGWLLVGNDGGAAEPRHVLTLDHSDPSIAVGSIRHGGAYTMLPPFARAALLATAGDDIIYGYNARYEFLVYSRDGELRRVVRAGHVPQPVRAEHIARARKDFIPGPDWSPRRPREEVARLAREFARTFDGLDHPATMPAWGRLLGDVDGTVWVRNYLPPGDTVPEYWARFDSTGRLLGTLHIPHGTRVVRFDRGHIILREQIDADGFVALRVHRIDPAPKE